MSLEIQIIVEHLTLDNCYRALKKNDMVSFILSLLESLNEFCNNR